MIKCQFLWVSPKPSTNTVDLIDVLPSFKQSHIPANWKKEIMHSKVFGEGYWNLPSLSETFCLGQFRGQKQPFSLSQTFCLGLFRGQKQPSALVGNRFKLPLLQIWFVCKNVRCFRRASFQGSTIVGWVAHLHVGFEDCTKHLHSERDGVAKGKSWETVWAPSLWNRDTVLRGPGLRVPGVLPPPEV